MLIILVVMEKLYILNLQSVSVCICKCKEFKCQRYLLAIK